ncbi:MAG: hypothetical protein ACXWTH_03300 [Methylosarcina sp.]
MKKMIVLAILVLAGNTSALATNDGHLDGVWLSARIKITVPRVIGFTGNGPFEQFKSYPIDTGKDNCFVQLKWNGVDSFSYDLNPFCLNGNSQWESGEFAEELPDKLYELNDGKSLGSDWTYVYFPQAGRTFAGFPEGYAYTGFEGTLILTPSFNSSGAVKSIKATNNAGMIYSWDSASGIGGTARSTGLKLKFVKTENVPAGAITCAAGGAAPLCP